MIGNAMDYTVSLAGKELAADKMHIGSLSVTYSINKTGKADLSVHLWNENTIALADDDKVLDKFAIGTAIQIEMGYGGTGKMLKVFDGEIVEHKMTFGIPPTLAVSCQCNSLKLTGAQKSRIFAESDKSDGTITVSKVVKQVAQEAGLQAECDVTDTYNQLVQRKQNNWDFLLQLARVNGACLYVLDETVYLKKIKDGSSADFTYSWGQDLRTLQINLDTKDVPYKVKCRAIEAATEDPADTTVELSSLKMPMAKMIAGLLKTAKKTDAKEIPIGSDDVDADELKRKATAYLTHSLLRAASGNATLAANPKIGVNTVFAVENAGKYTSKQYISGVTHSISASDFITSVTFGLEDLRPPSNDGGDFADEATRVSAGGLVIGKVEAYDDSQKLGLVKISLPWMSDDSKPTWALLAAPGAGDKRGFMAIPEPGDQVVLGFIDDDITSPPVILGSLWNSKINLPGQYDPENNHSRAWISRSGHQIVLDDNDDKQQILVKSQAEQSILIDDTSGSEKIELTDKAGNQVQLDASGSGKIVLKDKTGNSITLDSAGITIAAAAGKKIQIESASGDVQITGNNVKGEGKMALELAGTTGKLEGKTKLDLTGAQLNLQGSAMLQAQAPLIKLN